MEIYIALGKPLVKFPIFIKVDLHKSIEKVAIIRKQCKTKIQIKHDKKLLELKKLLKNFLKSKFPNGNHNNDSKNIKKIYKSFIALRQMMETQNIIKDNKDCEDILYTKDFTSYKIMLNLMYNDLYDIAVYRSYLYNEKMAILSEDKYNELYKSSQCD